MGAFALAIVWLNTILIAASAWKGAGALGVTLSGLRASLRRGELVRARVVRGEGEGGVIAERRVQQVGRAMTTNGPDRILFTDRASETCIRGGEVEIDGVSVALAPADAQVWTLEGSGRREPDGFDAAWSRAATNKGVESGLVIGVGAGDVWIRGKRDGARISADLVATLSPIAVISRARMGLHLFALGSLVTVAGITAICLVPPVFGTVSTVGGVLMIAFFILVQPLGVMVRDATRLPPERLVGGIWQRPAH